MENKETITINSNNVIIRTADKIQLKDSVKAFKQSGIEITSFLEGVPSKIYNTIQQCFTKENSTEWKVRRVFPK